MQHTCQICGRTDAQERLIPAAIIRPAVIEVIRGADPDWSMDGYICSDDLDAYRSQYIESLLESEKGDLSSLEDRVVESLREHEIISSNIEEEVDTAATLGQRLSDRLASFGGSWRFIILFGGILVVWIVVNSLALLHQPFDPYPFILLNLVLSCLAAMQAPVIMMSQNRKEAKDRRHSEHDYQVNLKAELEIRHLHQKVDHLLTNQWERLIEIQQIQVELLNDMRKRGPAVGQ